MTFRRLMNNHHMVFDGISILIIMQNRFLSDVRYCKTVCFTKYISTAKYNE